MALQSLLKHSVTGTRHAQSPAGQGDLQSEEESRAISPLYQDYSEFPKWKQHEWQAGVE